MAEVYTHGRKAFEDALTGRSVCSRKVLIEKDFPKYRSSLDIIVDKDFITSMGLMLLMGETIHKTINIFGQSDKEIKKPQKYVQNSIWEIAKFTAKTWLSRFKSKRVPKEK